jgi:hypothetical protein
MNDVYDSPNWKRHPELVFEEGHMGFILFADGMSLFNSSNMTVALSF